MSAVIQNEYTGNNSTTTYSFTFPYLKTSDIKASLNGVDTTSFTLPSATTLQFDTAPGQGVKIQIFRETSVDDLTATFYAGSAIKSQDLNDNFTQNLYVTQEVNQRYVSNLGGSFDGNIQLKDNVQLHFGDGNDLAIWHAGDNSAIKDLGQGSLLIESNGSGIYLNKTDATGTTSEAMANFIADGAVELFHNGTKKFETTSYGVSITGSITGILDNTVTASTQSAGDNSNKIATTAYVDGADITTEQVQDLSLIHISEPTRPY